MHESIVPHNESRKSKPISPLSPTDGFCGSSGATRHKSMAVEKCELPVALAMQPDWVIPTSDAIEQSDLTTIELIEMTCMISRILDIVDLAFEKHGISSDSPAFRAADERQSY